jgi:hypothetical protein
LKDNSLTLVNAHRRQTAFSVIRLAILVSVHTIIKCKDILTYWYKRVVYCVTHYVKKVLNAEICVVDGVEFWIVISVFALYMAENTELSTG